jgi:endoglucanase
VTTIPPSVAPGSYVLRHEIIALHEGNRQNAAQMYPQCINLEITGSGTAQPAGVVATELYDAADPGIFFNPYTNDLVYPIPGPVNSFASGGDGGSAPAPAPSTAPEEPEEQPSQPPANDDDTETAPAPAPTTLATSTRVATPTQPPSNDGGCGAAPQANALYQQCGGINFSGSTTCAEGTCVEQNPYYSQCVPASN